MFAEYGITLYLKIFLRISIRYKKMELSGISSEAAEGTVRRTQLIEYKPTDSDYEQYRSYIESLEEDVFEKNVYSLTMNINPYAKINRKTWSHYVAARQSELLTSLLKLYCIHKDYEVDYECYHFEECKNGNIHLHTKLYSRFDTASEIEDYLNSKLPFGGTYKTFCVDLLVTTEDEERWEKYCQKDALTE